MRKINENDYVNFTIAGSGWSLPSTTLPTRYVNGPIWNSEPCTGTNPTEPGRLLIPNKTTGDTTL